MAAKRPNALKLLSADAKQAAAPRGWEAALLRTAEGAVKRSLANALTILGCHPNWDSVLAYDAFTESIVSTRPPPVREHDRPTEHHAGEWTEADSVRTSGWLAEQYRVDFGVQLIEQAVTSVARKCIVHPVREYLRSLEWDGTVRLLTWLARYLGAEQTPYTSAIGTRFLVSAIARVEKPGCKADYLLVLEGPQGIGKSTVVALLARRPEWYSDTGIVLGDKDSYQNLRGKWIYEFAELASVKSARDVERYKAFLSSPVDSYRPSFGRRRVDFPRQTVFIGTTNEAQYLADKSGNRRFWPVRCSRIDLPGLERDCDQLWAEAVVRYSQGEVWHVDHLDLAQQCAEEQDARTVPDDWETIVGRWLEAPTIPVEGSRNERDRVSLEVGVTTADVLLGGLGLRPADITDAATQRAGRILRSLGFERRQVRLQRVDGLPGREQRREWRYFRVSPSGEVEDEPVTGPVTPEPGENMPLSPSHQVSLGFSTHTREGPGGERHSYRSESAGDTGDTMQALGSEDGQ